MECAESLELLSEFYANQLNETLKVAVTEHLVVCVPCADVFQDLTIIICSATSLRAEEGIRYPDERAVWQRVNLK